MRRVAQAQKTITSSFESSASYWQGVYDENSFLGSVYRERQAAALAWIDAFGLPAGSRVLEIGCGAGYLTVALAARGYRVESIDSSEAMVAATRARIVEAGQTATATARVEDVHALQAADASYAGVVALGVMPWLHSPHRALREIARVLRPGGAVILTADNRARLNFVLDPRYNPVLAYPIKRGVKLVLQRLGKRPMGPLPDLHYPAEVDRLIRLVGLTKRQSRTIGFG